MKQKLFLFNLSPHYGLIKIQGNEGLTFLQGLLTCDMNDLQNKSHCFGALCNLKGRVRALFRIFKNENNLYLLTPKELIPLMLPVLKKHALFSKISFTDASEEKSLWGMANELNENDINEISEKILSYAPEILKINISHSRHIFILEPNISLTEKLQELQKLKDFPPNDTAFEEADFERWKLFDIQSGIPEVWRETTEKFLPHHLNLPKLGAVSFTKGCYCGQEIVARMEYKGKIKYGLAQRILSINSYPNPIPNPGSEISFELGKEVNHDIVVTVSTTHTPETHLLTLTEI